MFLTMCLISVKSAVSERIGKGWWMHVFRMIPTSRLVWLSRSSKQTIKLYHTFKGRYLSVQHPRARKFLEGIELRYRE